MRRIAASILLMGRASLGVRVQCNVRLDPQLLAEIDSARGPVSRDRWFDSAARLALKPTSVYQDTSLAQPTHEHRAVTPLRTEWRNGVKLRVYECDCGIEVTG